jgi:hypothetical protein
MTTPHSSGSRGEAEAKSLLSRERVWKFSDTRPIGAGGHRLDLGAIHLPTGLEWLIEVKTWDTVSGRDTVKKAIADAYDMREAGEQRLIMLVISEHLGGLLGDMLRRARRAGAINDIRITGTWSNYDDLPPNDSSGTAG